MKIYNYLRFFSSLSFYRSLSFCSYLKSNDKTDVLFYYPQNFSFQSKFPLLISPLIKSLKKNDLTCVVIEEPNINYKKKRSKDVIPFDLIWFLVIVLRKFYRGKNYNKIDTKIGKLLSNFFGGLMIFLDRPFGVGDWIRSPDRDIEGTVESLGWRLTTIRTFDKRPLYVPNAAFLSIAVENPSRMSHRRIYETIGVRYDDANQIQTIVERVKAMLEQHPDIDSSQTLMVNFNQFSPSSLDFFIYCFTKTTVWTEYHAVKEDVLLKAYELITHLGAEVAFPTRTLHLQVDPEAPQVQSAQQR